MADRPTRQHWTTTSRAAEIRTKISDAKRGRKRPDVAGPNQWNWKGGKPSCAGCGTTVSSYSAKRCRPCINKLRVGSASVLWRGGRMAAYRLSEQIRKSPAYKVWRTHVFQRDNYTCQACGCRSGIGQPVKLHADHVMPFSLFPDLRLEILNGRTLCVPCHRRTPTWANIRAIEQIYA